MSSSPSSSSLPLISVIIPFHNVGAYFWECLNSVAEQTYEGPIELCLVDDASTDDSLQVVERFSSTVLPLHARISLKLHHEASGQARGPGWARNVAIKELASSDWLCLLDADDVCLPERLARQLAAVQSLPDDDEQRHSTLVGSQFVRVPDDSTPVYTAWANGLTAEQLYLHRFRCVTLIQPTWFMHRSIWARVGGYDEAYPAHPEDMTFFYAHLKLGGRLLRVDVPLVKYRYSPGSASSKITRVDLLKHRAKFLQDTVLRDWPRFSIWGAGRDGRRLYNMLDKATQLKCVAMADIDPAKIGRDYVNCWTQQKIPIVHFADITPPFITCVAVDRFPEFLANVQRLGYREGEDYYFIM